jgi:hypothetical protein
VPSNARYPAAPFVGLSVKVSAGGVDHSLVSTASTVLPGVPASTEPSRNGWLASAVAGLILIAALVPVGVLIACLVNRALYDPYGLGHSGWELDLTIGSIAVSIAVVLVISGRAVARSQRRLPRRSRHTGAIIAVVLLPGLWLGALTSSPIRAALTAASGSASRPLTDGQTGAAVAQLAGGVHAPAGWTRSAKFCTQGYACWTSPQQGFFTKPGLVALAKEFGIRLESTGCDEPLISVNGRAIQSCDGGGVTARYEVAVILQVKRGDAGMAGTEIDVAPVRMLN